MKFSALNRETSNLKYGQLEPSLSHFALFGYPPTALKPVVLE